MFLMMIAASFILITLMILAYTFWGKLATDDVKNTDNESDLETFKADYLAQKTTLNDLHAMKQIDQVQLEERMTLLGRDLLEQTRNIQNQTSKNKPLNTPAYIILKLLFLCVPFGAMGIYFHYSYSADIAAFDHNNKILGPVLNKWVGELTNPIKINEISKINEKNEANEVTKKEETSEQSRSFQSLEQLNPPTLVRDNLAPSLAILKSNQAKSGFKDFDGLSLLASLYFQSYLFESKEFFSLAKEPSSEDMLKMNQKLSNLFGSAQAFYEKALLIKPTDFDTLTMLTKLDLLVNNNQLSQNSKTYFEKLIVVAPTNKDVLMNYALALFKSGELEASLTIWKKIAALYPKDDDTHRIISTTIAQLQARIPEMKQKNSRENSQISQDDSKSSSEKLSPQTESQAESKTINDISSDSKRIIEVTLNAPLSIDTQRYPSAKLYLYAKTPDQKGPPILAKQMPLPERFPITLTLSNDDKMMQNMPNIEDLALIQVEAKISLEGSATPDDSDLKTEVKIIKPENNSFSLMFIQEN